MAFFLHQWTHIPRGFSPLHAQANHPPIASRCNILQNSTWKVAGWVLVDRLAMSFLDPGIFNLHKEVPGLWIVGVFFTGGKTEKIGQL